MRKKEKERPRASLPFFANLYFLFRHFNNITERYLLQGGNAYGFRLINVQIKCILRLLDTEYVFVVVNQFADP